MKVELLRATRPIIDQWTEGEGKGFGLITFQLTIPLYVWTELLTHRSLARNASSARAMSTKRYVDMGYYTPEIFYKSGKGMQAGSEPVKHQRLARLIWHTSSKLSQLGAYLLDKLEVSKEQKNRLIAPNKYIRGIVTGTEQAWKDFIFLRDSVTADRAMQIVAREIYTLIYSLDPEQLVTYYGSIFLPSHDYPISSGYFTPQKHTDRWTRSNTHNPFPDLPLDRAIARIARVSYDRTSGKDDTALYNQLIQDKHFSPFEHIAEWVENPKRNCHAVKLNRGFGWESERAKLGY